MGYFIGVVLLIFFEVLAVHSAYAQESNSPPPAPDSGLTGLHVVSVNVAETVDYEMQFYPIDSPLPCGDLTGLFEKAGLRIRKAGQPENPETGILFLSIDRESYGQEKYVLYVVNISLSQDVRLTRDPTRKLSVPSTYVDERYGVVARNDVQQKTCTELKSMLSNFLSLWQGWNHSLVRENIRGKAKNRN